MIDELHITGLGVLDDATLRLSPGLTVVTGETGAGKTIVVTALQLLLGERADTTLVRTGRERAVIEARLRPPPPGAGDWLDEGDDELVVSREIAAGGRSRVRINGRLATVASLAEVLGSVVEVHAQHAHVALADPGRQRDLLDRYAGDAHARNTGAYADAYGAWRAAADRLAVLEGDERERAREADRLRFEVDEIDGAGLDVGVDARIASELDVLEHAEELQQAASEAARALGDDGASEPMGTALAALRRPGVDDEVFQALRERAESLVAETTELARDVRSYGEDLEADPQRLESLRARSQLLANLRRKYGDDIGSVLAYADEARARLETLESDRSEAAGLRAALDEGEAEVSRLALEVRRGRELAATKLAETVNRHLAELGMELAELTVEVLAVGTPGPHGADRVRFLLAANPGDPPRGLTKAASGGERSRVALAVEVALADVIDARVLVFDEVDAGVGGATAMAVGEKLARLAVGEAGRQVLCVTHLPQLAAFADVHHVVEKGVADGRATTTARRVDAGDRAAEIARMLSGDPGREEGVQHARALLAEADGRRAV